MILAVALQLAAAVALIAGGFILAEWGGVLLAASVPTFLVGWQLEQRHGGS